MGITMRELSELTGVTAPTLYNIDKGKNISVEVINKIYDATKKKYGFGLAAEEYTDIRG